MKLKNIRQPTVCSYCNGTGTIIHQGHRYSYAVLCHNQEQLTLPTVQIKHRRGFTKTLETGYKAAPRTRAIILSNLGRSGK